MKPRLTALITNYNYGRFLAAAVEAMVNQSRPADELILIDDASTDGSQRVVDELGRRFPFIKILKHAANRGVIPTGKEALALATGDYFYWGAADDMVLPGFFAGVMKLAEEFPQAPMCAGIPARFLESTGEQFQTCVGMPERAGFLAPRALWRFAAAGVLDVGGAWAVFRLSDFAAMGGIRAPLKSHWDWFVSYGLALGRGLAWTAQPAAVMRFHAQSYSSACGADREAERDVFGHLAAAVAGDVPEDIRRGFRDSGVLARMGSPMFRVLWSQRRFWFLTSGRYWRTRIRLRAITAAARLAGPRAPLRWHPDVARRHSRPTSFDLSIMNARNLA